MCSRSRSHCGVLILLALVLVLLLTSVLVAAAQAGPAATVRGASPHVRRGAGARDPVMASAGQGEPSWSWVRGGGPSNGATLRAVDALSPTDAWAVGDQGVLLHWDGAKWQSVTSPTTDALYGIDVVSATAGWAVGGDCYGWDAHGTALRYDGASWQPVEPGSWAGMSAVSMVSETDGWATGFHSMRYAPMFDYLLRWEGASWQQYAEDALGGSFPTAISMAGPDHGWMASENLLRRWDGQAWGELLASPISIAALDATADIGGWAVGDGFLQLDPFGKWPAVPAASLHAVRVLAAGDAWAAGEQGVIYHWDGADWGQVDSPVSETLFGLAFSSPADGWAVGEGGVILHWDGRAWAVVFPGSSGETLYGVDIVSATDAWAVGDGGTILRWDGATWAPQPSPTTDALTDVAMLNASEGWAVGAMSTFLHWNGSAWQRVPGPPGTYELTAVDIVRADAAWAAGDEGYKSCFFRWDGVRWTRLESPAPGLGPITSLDMVSTIDGWVVGPDASRILRWDGSRWTNYLGAGQALRGVKVISATSGWMVGCQWLRWDGTGWQPAGSLACLNSVDLTPWNEGWAVGDNGKLAYWSGATWRLSADAAPTHLIDVSLAPSGDGWAVGASGLIVRLTGGRAALRFTYLPLLHYR